MRRLTVFSVAVLCVLLALPALAGRQAFTAYGDIYVEIRNDASRGLHYYIETGSTQLCEHVLVQHSYERQLGGPGLPSTWFQQNYLFTVNQQHGGIFFINLDWFEEQTAQNHWFSATCHASDSGPSYKLGDVYLYTPWYGVEGLWWEYPFNPPRPWWIP
jgi:hypothetical protein